MKQCSSDTGCKPSRLTSLFPEPFQRLHGITVWLRADVEAWIAEHGHLG